jgi:DHA1 family bicyclomycin/chloramphenicol resistance-like MFS transporter
LTALVLVATSWAADWKPQIGLFMAVLIAVNGFYVMLFPSATSRALEPMGERAGMAAAVIGSIRTAGGALLAWIINDGVGDTVRSFAIGFAIYGFIGMVFTLWALRESTRLAEPAPAIASP